VISVGIRHRDVPDETLVMPEMRLNARRHRQGDEALLQHMSVKIHWQIEHGNSDYDHEKNCRKRLAKLAGGIAVSSKLAARPKSK
jgi:hypothetical protein